MEEKEVGNKLRKKEERDTEDITDTIKIERKWCAI